MIHEHINGLGKGPWLQLGSRYMLVSYHNLQQLYQEQTMLEDAIEEMKSYLTT